MPHHCANTTPNYMICCLNLTTRASSSYLHLLLLLPFLFLAAPNGPAGFSFFTLFPLPLANLFLWIFSLAYQQQSSGHTRKFLGTGGSLNSIVLWGSQCFLNFVYSDVQIYRPHPFPCLASMQIDWRHHWCKVGHILPFTMLPAYLSHHREISNKNKKDG